MAEENFSFLDQAATERQIRTVASGKKANEQADNLSSVLANVNQTLRKTVSKKRDSEVFFTSQANKLASESGNVTNQILRAKADPFHGIKVLFGSADSIDDLAVKHNSIQNQLNKVERRFAGGQAEFNAEVSDLQTQLGFARGQLDLTDKDIARQQAVATSINTQINSRLKVQEQGLNNLLLPDLKLELADPKSLFQKKLVQDRIDAIEEIQLRKLASTNTAGKSTIELFTQKSETLDKFGKHVDESLVDLVLSTGQTQFSKQLGVPITVQDATLIKPQIEKFKLEDAELRAKSINDSIAAVQTLNQLGPMLQRFAGAGVDTKLRDEKGNPIGINTDAFTPEIQQQVVELQQAELAFVQMDAVTRELPEGRQKTEALQATAAFRKEIITRGDKLNVEVAKIAASRFKGEEAQKAASDWVITRRIESQSGAIELMTEDFAVALPRTNTSESHGVGYGQAATVLSELFVSQVLEDAGENGNLDFNSEDGEQAFLASLQNSIRGKTQATTSMSKALSTLTKSKNPMNAVQASALEAWSQLGLLTGLELLKSQHSGEPDTLRLLNQFSKNGRTFAGSILTATDDNGTEIAGFDLVFAKIRMGELDLIKSGALPKDSDLTSSLATGMLSPDFYKMPQIVGMISPQQSEVAGAISRTVFRNQPMSFFMPDFKSLTMSVPLDNLDQAIKFVDAELKIDELKTKMRTDPTNETAIAIKHAEQVQPPEGASLIQAVRAMRRQQAATGER